MTNYDEVLQNIDEHKNSLKDLLFTVCPKEYKWIEGVDICETNKCTECWNNDSLKKLLIHSCPMAFGLKCNTDICFRDRNCNNCCNSEAIYISSEELEDIKQTLIMVEKRIKPFIFKRYGESSKILLSHRQEYRLLKLIIFNSNDEIILTKEFSWSITNYDHTNVIQICYRIEELLS